MFSSDIFIHAKRGSNPHSGSYSWGKTFQRPDLGQSGPGRKCPGRPENFRAGQKMPGPGQKCFDPPENVRASPKINQIWPKFLFSRVHYRYFKVILWLYPSKQNYPIIQTSQPRPERGSVPRPGLVHRLLSSGLVVHFYKILVLL